MKAVSKNQKEKEQLKKSLKSWAQYSVLGFQMAALISGGLFLGRWLDQKYPSDKAWFTLAGALLGTALGLYYGIKTVNSTKDL